jgi:hypothetical protein
VFLRKCCEYSGEVTVRWLVKVLENEERRKEEEEQDALTLAAVQSRIASWEIFLCPLQTPLFLQL